MPAAATPLGDYLPLPWYAYLLTGQPDTLHLGQVETSVGFGQIPQKTQDDWRLLSGQERAFLRSFASTPPAIGRAEERWHHEFWAGRRGVVARMLSKLGVPLARRERFACCGSESFVRFSPSRKRHKVVALFCHDRWCERCAKSRANVVASGVLRLLAGRRLLHIVVTWRHEARALGDQLTDLKRCFRNLRNTKEWKARIAGAVAFVEVKVSKADGLWHPHLHVLAEGKWFSVHRLRRLWHRITGHSWNCDVSAVTSERKVRNYVCKYACKPFDPSVFQDEARLAECMRTLHGTRLYDVYGSWRKTGLESEDRGSDDWVRVGRLDSILAAAGRGEEWAQAVVRSLRPQRSGAGSAAAAGPAVGASRGAAG